MKFRPPALVHEEFAELLILHLPRDVRELEQRELDLLVPVDVVPLVRPERIAQQVGQLRGDVDFLRQSFHESVVAGEQLRGVAFGGDDGEYGHRHWLLSWGVGVRQRSVIPPIRPGQPATARFGA